MQLETIKAASNGFILEDCYGNLHIAKTLVEAATIIGEIDSTTRRTTVYNSGYSERNLQEARKLAGEGNKIKAIKVLRDCFEPPLGLKEAKELIEQLCL